MANKPKKLRAQKITPNQNISFPIGTILAVQEFYNHLALDWIFSKFKNRGRDLNNLIQALLSYRLSENRSITCASDWTNRQEVLEVFNLESFEKRTLYRTLELLGRNRIEIMAGIQDIVFSFYDFPHTNINMDWTSLVLYGQKCPIGKKGYSRDHRPDKKQITVGLSELSSPINIPIGMTVREGNVNDQLHFIDTFEQIKEQLNDESIVVFDQGANRKENLERIENNRLNYVTARQINSSDMKTWIRTFDKSQAELVDEKHGIYGLKKQFPSRVNYLFFSEKLHGDQIETKLRKVDRLFKEAEVIQKSIENNRQLPKRYRINNPLIECEYSYQTRLTLMSEEEAKEILRKAAITGKEGFFCLVSNIDLTLPEVLALYRQKDSIEKIFNSLKNEIEIKPLRVWSEHGIYGALIIGFLAQLFISLIRFEHPELKHTSPKFIIVALMNLTVTVEKRGNQTERYIFSNFNPISEVILAMKGAKT